MSNNYFVYVGTAVLAYVVLEACAWAVSVFVRSFWTKAASVPTRVRV